MPEIEIRRATNADVSAILGVMRASLGETPVLRRTPKLWEWKHTANPFGRSIVLVAESDERVVGVRAFMRWALTTPSGDTVACVRAVDTATHPEFLRRGIFRSLTETAVDIARDEDVHLIFNTPNEKSAPGYLKMGWREVARLGVLARPRVLGNHEPAGDEIPDIARLAPIAEEFAITSKYWEPRDALGYRTPRSPEYFAWRFNSHPKASYGFVEEGEATAVIRASQRGNNTELVLSDLLGQASPRPVRRAARSSRARYMAGWFSPGSPERSATIRAGLVPIPRVSTLRLVARPLADLPMDPLSLDSWDLATSDLELL